MKNTIPPTAAVIVPAYNAAATITETLDSLQANSAINMVSKVILLNDCSTDDTSDVARKCWHSRVPLEIWNNPVNMKERRTTNEAILRLAKSFDWTFILHSDDVVKPNWLSLYFSEFGKIPNKIVSICSSYDAWWPSSGRIEKGEELENQPAEHVPGNKDSLKGTLEKGCWWHISGCAIRNKAFIEVGPFEPDMPQLGDWEWLLRCLSKGYGIWYIPRSTMLYRQHDNSVSSNSFREGQDLRERRRIFSMLQTQGLLDREEHRKHVRTLICQLARRTLVRIVRGDWHGFMSHYRLFQDTGVEYLQGRI